MNIGATLAKVEKIAHEANEVIDDLIQIGEQQGLDALLTVLSIAKEHADMPAVAGQLNLAAGTRLLRQLNAGIAEAGRLDHEGDPT